MDNIKDLTRSLIDIVHTLKEQDDNEATSSATATGASRPESVNEHATVVEPSASESVNRVTVGARRHKNKGHNGEAKPDTVPQSDHSEADRVSTHHENKEFDDTATVVVGPESDRTVVDAPSMVVAGETSGTVNVTNNEVQMADVTNDQVSTVDDTNDQMPVDETVDVTNDQVPVDEAVDETNDQMPVDETVDVTND